MVPQPARGQRTGTEGDEAAQGQADQRGIVHGKNLGHAQYRRREDQHEHVIDDMGGIDVTNDISGLVHGGTLRHYVATLNQLSALNASR